MDLLLHRYADFSYILTLDADTATRLISEAEKQEREARLRRQWEAQLPAMALTGKAISFEAYRDQATGANIDTRPAPEIFAELEEVERQLEEVGS